jgi:hypothetical protein
MLWAEHIITKSVEPTALVKWYFSFYNGLKPVATILIEATPLQHQHRSLSSTKPLTHIGQGEIYFCFFYALKPFATILIEAMETGLAW